MKKIKFEKKLQLNKETVARLNDGEMSNVHGGDAGFLSLWRCTPKSVTCETDTCTLTDGISCDCEPLYTRYCPAPEG